jgi:hypothetical protein
MEVHMLLRIQYQDNKYNYVSPENLDELIMSRKIRQFFRPSEKRWVDIEEAARRGYPRGAYSGPERRMVQAV